MFMKRSGIDHILRAAAEVTKQSRFVLVGSAAVIVRSKHIPLDMTETAEADLYAPDAADVEFASELIDGSIGQGSQFHSQFGYYGDGVSPTTAKMPEDWQERAIEYQGNECPGVIAIVPEQNDIALAKLVAWREKDQKWLKVGVKVRTLSLDVMASRLGRMPKSNAEGNPPDYGVLADRLRSLAAHCNIALAMPDRPLG